MLLGLLLIATPPALAQLAEGDWAEELVRAHYAEGLPYAEARELTPAGVERLIEMLRDPTEAEHHENIVMALGISGAPRAYPALVAFHDREVAGEVDATEYRARRALPLAMGHLARNDSHALQFLIRVVRAEATSSIPGWSYRHLGGKRLEGVLRRAAITGLAISARVEAVALLRELDEQSEADSAATEELRTHIREARDLCDRMIREGPDRVYGAGFSP